MSNNMKDKFIASNYDEVDLVLDTDRRFEEAIAAADAGETDLVDVIVKDLKESGSINTIIEEDDVTEYNPEDDDAVGILDTTAEDIREYATEEDFNEDEVNGDIIDQIMDDNNINPEYAEYDDED